MSEDASSWHHAMRLFVMEPKLKWQTQVRVTSTRHRWLWFMSSVLLVLTQLLVLLSFAASLSFKRCTSGANCLSGSYCAGRFVTQPAADPFNDLDQAVILKGTCMSCSSRLPDGIEVPDLLEVACEPLMGPSSTCFDACASTCLASFPGVAQLKLADAAAGRFDISDYAHSLHTLGGDANVRMFLTVQSVLEQCTSCSSSMRTAKKYLTQSESERAGCMSRTAALRGWRLCDSPTPASRALWQSSMPLA